MMTEEEKTVFDEEQIPVFERIRFGCRRRRVVTSRARLVVITNIVPVSSAAEKATFSAIGYEQRFCGPPRCATAVVQVPRILFLNSILRSRVTGM